MSRFAAYYFVLLVVVGPTHGQEVPPKSPEPSRESSLPAHPSARSLDTSPDANAKSGASLLQGEAVNSSDVPEAANDEAFNRYVRFAELADLINARKPEALADFALLTAEAEKVLGRSHRSGVTAQKLLTLAVEMARQESDETTVTRVQQRLQNSYANIALERAPPSVLSQQLTREMAKAGDELPASTAPEARKSFSGMLGDVKTAVLLQNANRLIELEGIAGRLSDLPTEARSKLVSVIKSAGKFESTNSEGAKALTDLLSSLAAQAGAIFYEHSWGGGATYTIYGDQFERSNMPHTWNDVVSSLWIRRGHLVYCYEHVNYGGARCWGLTGSNGNPESSPFRESRVNGTGLLFEMSTHGWNDVVSSFRLQPW